MPVTLALVGAGMRGSDYGRRAVRDGRARVVAVADPVAERRERATAEHGLGPDQVFTDWRELAALPRQADGVIVATRDGEHLEPAVAFAERGYHLLLEKPMAPTEAGSAAIAAAAERAGVMLAVCHVMRYSAYTRALKALIDAGRIGAVVSVQHLEPIGWWHFAHSYVRGNWRREDESSPMLLAKCCHDIDWLAHVIGRPAARVSSFGALTHFRPENRPEGAADRCLDCAVEPSCPYSAPRTYLGFVGDPDRAHWPLSALTFDTSPEGVRAALRDGPYGRCVYTCDNDVVDQQVVTIEYEGGVTASFTATAFTPMGFRKTRIFGSHGFIEGDGVRLTVEDFVTGGREVVETDDGEEVSLAGDHGGADQALADAFVAALAAGDPSLLLSDARTSLASHRLVWAAERARRTGTVVSLTDGATPAP
ncbi:Gfo/Idh/MocA family oxidoreductase [Actinoallomurus spadix]|uniref:Gfo/Idh/MocA family oxidoreductase n=1 Tax=Actinoallomurus spadix TaxID=79912 RepID=A0ABN0WBS6_9ACTN|nr:Gfo/Idh/MocA family oxidoreductase [Actinoallomurus spadix]MCO5988556.1 Gfo/Idh/MocA family oxidoreductase [Actinoallomurus spadix]